LGKKIDEEVLAEVVGGGVEGPSLVDLGDLLDELDQVGVLAEHEDVQVDAAGRAFLKLQQGLCQGLGMGGNWKKTFPFSRWAVGSPSETMIICLLGACSRLRNLLARMSPSSMWYRGCPGPSSSRAVFALQGAGIG